MSITNRLEIQARASNTPTWATPLTGGPNQLVDFYHVFTEGLNAGQVGQVYFATRSLVASASEDLDVSGPTLKEVDSTALALVKLRVLAVRNDGPGYLSVSRPAANGVPLFLAASDGIAVPPGGILWWCCGATDAGITTAAGTADLITVTETGGVLAADYTVLLAGV